MTNQLSKLHRFTKTGAAFLGLAISTLALSPLAATSAYAQIESIDPNDVIDADLDNPESVARDEAQAARNAVEDATTNPDFSRDVDLPSDAGVDFEQAGDLSGVDVETVGNGGDLANNDALPGPSPDGAGFEDVPANGAQASNGTFQQDDLIGAAEGVFGKGAKGLASLIEDILKDQGQPNGYIVGREAGGAFVLGLRYGSGTLYHAIEGERPVYWTGPSIGVDAGANAANSFTLVYNLYDSEDLYKRFGAGEGQAYLIGGFNASYLRRGNVVLIPIRVGVGARLGANIGYRKFSKKQRWFPF